MEYKIANSTKEFNTVDAALLTQRLVPLAKLYRDLFLIRKQNQLPEDVYESLNSNCKNIANEIVSQILVFIDENPYDIQCG